MKNAKEPYWTSTAFKGRDAMTCEVIKNGMTVCPSSIWSPSD